MSMLQIGILGVAGVLLALQFKSGKSEYGIYISIALGMLIFALQIEVFAKITILVLSLPVLSALLQTIRGFLV